MRDRIHFTTLKPILAGALLLGTGALGHGHHSFAGFDKSRVLVLTGMVTSYKPHPNHAEFAFVPLNPDHTGLQQDAQGNPLAWQVELEYGAALAAKDDRITDGTFRKGTLVSVALHPMMNGDRKGARVGPIIRCPGNKPPQPGKHCDSVDGHVVHGEGRLATPQ